jgi:hypothetical protein
MFNIDYYRIDTHNVPHIKTTTTPTPTQTPTPTTTTTTTLRTPTTIISHGTSTTEQTTTTTNQTGTTPTQATTTPRTKNVDTFNGKLVNLENIFDDQTKTILTTETKSDLGMSAILRFNVDSNGVVNKHKVFVTTEYPGRIIDMDFDFKTK